MHSHVAKSSSRSNDNFVVPPFSITDAVFALALLQMLRRCSLPKTVETARWLLGKRLQPARSTLTESFAMGMVFFPSSPMSLEIPLMPSLVH